MDDAVWCGSIGQDIHHGRWRDRGAMLVTGVCEHKEIWGVLGKISEEVLWTIWVGCGLLIQGGFDVG
jgi:hypothetical protein